MPVSTLLDLNKSKIAPDYTDNENNERRLWLSRQRQLSKLPMKTWLLARFFDRKKASMKDFQQKQLRIPAIQRLQPDHLPRILGNVQPDGIQQAYKSRRPFAHNGRDLRATLERLRKRLEARANTLNKRRRTRRARAHWQTRGRQEFLRSVSRHLRELCVKYDTFSTLYPAFKDYLRCLEKYEVDVEEERKAQASYSRWPIQQWRAEGASRELPTALADLLSILLAYTPLVEQSLLSFDGSHFILHQDENRDVQRTRMLSGGTDGSPAL